MLCVNIAFSIKLDHFVGSVEKYSFISAFFISTMKLKKNDILKYMSKLSKFFLSVTLCELVGLVALPITQNAIPTWYAMLEKPVFSPPNWVFGPVWTLLYLLMGIALYYVWTKKLKGKKATKKTAYIYFFLQLFFNFLWSLIFFGLHSPLFALLDIIVLLFFITLTTKAFFKISNIAGILMLPYLLWVIFATVLNAAIVLLN